MMTTEVGQHPGQGIQYVDFRLCWIVVVLSSVESYSTADSGLLAVKRSALAGLESR